MSEPPPSWWSWPVEARTERSDALARSIGYVTMAAAGCVLAPFFVAKAVQSLWQYATTERSS